MVNNVCNISISQLLVPCVKGNRLAIDILEDEYQLGLDACKHNLHGRVLWLKGPMPLTVLGLKAKLSVIWDSLG